MTIKRINPVNNARFNQFLRDNNVASKYYVNRAKQACKHLSECFIAYNLIYCCGFSWRNTPEGGPFWSAIDNKWTDICEQEKRRI